VVGETFTVNTNVDENDVCYDSDNILIKVHDFDATHAGRSYVDVVITVLASPNMVGNTSLYPLDTLHASPSCSLPSPSPECHNLLLPEYYVMLEGKTVDYTESLSTFRGYDPSLDTYILYPGNMLAKIMLKVAFNHSTNFSKAFNKFRRALIIISRFIFKFSYLHSSELHAQVHDKLLRALTASELRTRVLSHKEWLILLQLPTQPS